MFLLRSVDLNDLDGLYELSTYVQFINLPSDRKIIEDTIRSSLRSFEKPDQDLAKNYYLFLMEDLEKGNVVGACMVHAQHGTDDEPHFFLKVSQEHRFSQTINTGFIHGTLKLGVETNGPTEIGGLVLNPSYRGHKSKLGKQLSFVRFLYMGMNLGAFKDEVHSELMPPLDENGNSPLWEAIGRKFLNMDYHDADVLSRTNKEFILSLFPTSTIYEPLLPVDARNAIGKVGPDTTPVKNMLEKIGFNYTNEVDPFDGGPHYRARTSEIKPIKEMQAATVHINPEGEEFQYREGQVLLNFPHPDYSFAAISTDVRIEADRIFIPKKVFDQFGLSEGFNGHYIKL